MASIIDQELAVRAAILNVATPGTYLRKVNSPGRLYEEATAAEIVSEGGGVPVSVRLNFGWGDASPELIGSLSSNTVIIGVKIIILTAFDGTTPTLSVGTDVTHDLFMMTLENDPTIVGEYNVTPAYKLSGDTDIKLFITPGASAGAGSGVVIINY